MRLSGSDLKLATGGSWHNGMPETISGISTDTRKFIEGNAFLALRGPNFDGHLFAEKVAAEARALIGDPQGVGLWDNLDTPQLQVEDTTAALGDIANAWRNHLSQTTVIAISGSFGKTTVRSMLAHLFTSLNIETAATHANLNNLIGVPTTLLGIDQSAEVALIECGISEPEEMERLSQIVQPDVVVFTGISSAHSSGLGGIHGVAREKSKLLSHLLPQGWCVFGAGVSRYLQMDQIPNFSIDMDKSEGDIVHWQLDGCQLQLATAHESASLTLALPAEHWGVNMALAATIVLKYFADHPAHTMPKLQEIADILSDWKAVDGRMTIIEGKGGITILDDSYNANPASMQAALNTLSALSSRKVAIIGDMAELEDPATAHEGLETSGVDLLILVGSEMKALKKVRADARWFASTDEAMAWVETNSDQLVAGDYVLIKGSRSMKLDRMVRLLTTREALHAL